jgi:hypothetical protein
MLGIKIERYDIAGKTPDLMEALSVKFTEDAEEVQRRVLENVTGGMLHEYTGDLADSVLGKPAAIEGAEVSSSVQAGGGQAWYADLLQKGVPHSYEEDTKRGTQGKKKGGLGVLAFEIDGATLFRRVVEHPALQPRPFFNSVVEGMLPVIQQDTQETVEAVLNEQSRLKELYE